MNSLLKLPDYQVTDLIAPKRTASASASERITAHVSSESKGFLADADICEGIGSSPEGAIAASRAA